MPDSATNQATISNGATAGPSLADLNAAQSQSDQISTIMKRKDFDPSGASAKLRAIVGSYDNPDDQKAALEANGATNVIPFTVATPATKVDPSIGGAFSYPEDKPGSGTYTAPATGSTNFIYTDPETKRPTIYNPGFWKNPVGAVASIGPEVGEAAGGILGAIGGEAAMPAGGGIPGAGLGAATGKTAVQSLIHQLAGVDDSRSFGDKATDFAITAALNAAGAGVGELLPSPTGLIRRMLPRSTMDATSPESTVAANLHGAPVPANETDARVAASARQNVPMDNVTTYANPNVQQTGAVLSGLGPLGGGIKADIDRSLIQGGSAMDRITNQIAPNLGRVDERTVADQLSNTAQTAVDGFNQTRTALQTRLDNMAPPNTRVPATNTQNYLAQRLAENQVYPGLAGENANAVQMGNQIQQSLQNGTISLAELRSQRQALGQMAYGETPMPGQLVPRADAKLQGLYNAVRQDYIQGARSVSPQAGTAAQNLDDFVSRMRGPQTPRFDPQGNPLPPLNQLSIQDIGKLAATSPDTLANQIVKGGTSAGRTLEQIQNTLNSANQTAQGRAAAQEAWQNLQGAIWRRMGSAHPTATGASQDADMSFTHLATNWNNMDQRTRDVLMSRLPRDVRGNMHDLITLAKGAAQSAGRVNWSRSGDVINYAAMMNAVMKPIIQSLGQIGSHLAGGAAGAGAGSLLGPLGTLAGGAAGAIAPGQLYRLLGNPTFRNWMSAAARTRMNAPLPLRQLAGMAGSNLVHPQVRGLMNQYLAAQGYQPQ